MTREPTPVYESERYADPDEPDATTPPGFSWWRWLAWVVFVVAAMTVSAWVFR